MKLAIELTLDAVRCVEGTSLPFRITLRNDDAVAVAGIPSVLPRSAALRLIVRNPAGGAWVGLQLGANLREYNNPPNMAHWHDPGLQLAAGESTTVDGDVLNWVGALRAGDYFISAAYKWTGDPETPPIQSPAMSLQIWKARPNLVSVPQLPEMAYRSPMLAAWRHVGDDGKQLFLQSQSRRLPPNPYHCVPLEDPAPDNTPVVATTSVEGPQVAHVLWPAQSQLHVITTNPATTKTDAPQALPVAIKQPVILDAPRTTAEDDLLILLTDERGEQLHNLKFSRSGQRTYTELPLAAYGPLGKVCLFWTMEDIALVVWTRGSTREIFWGMITPDDPAGSFAPVAFGMDPGEILRIDARCRDTRNLLDLDPNAAPAPPPEPPDEDDPLRYHVYTALVHPVTKRFQVYERIVPHSNAELCFQLELGDAAGQKLKVLSSDMSFRHQPVYLIQAGERIFFASGLEEQLIPIEQRVGDSITAGMFPTIHAASEFLDDPWVYLRYVDPESGRFVYRKLEPEKEDDPYHLIEFDPTK